METVKIDNKQFYKQLLTLGAPVILQNFIQALVNMLDVFMIGQLGEAEITEVSLSNTERTTLPMIGTMVALFVNLALNYVLIFGHFGFPAMGVEGAAIATVISIVVQICVLYGVTWFKKYPICASLKGYFSWEKGQWRKYFRYGSFFILCEVVFGVGSNIYNIGYKYTGTNGQAALQIMNTFQQLSFIIAMGIGTAAGIMLGKLLGENRMELVKAYSKRFLILTPAAATVLGIIVYLCSPVLLGFFNINGQTMEYAGKLMIILALSLPLKAINFAIVAGILRSGGDSKYCFLCNFVGNWIIGIPMVFVGAVALELPIHWVYLLVCIGEFGKLAVGLPRTLSYKWVKNIT